MSINMVCMCTFTEMLHSFSQYSEVVFCLKMKYNFVSYHYLKEPWNPNSYLREDTIVFKLTFTMLQCVLAQFLCILDFFLNKITSSSPLKMIIHIQEVNIFVTHHKLRKWYQYWQIRNHIISLKMNMNKIQNISK